MPSAKQITGASTDARFRHAGPAALIWIGGALAFAWAALEASVGWPWVSVILAALVIAFWLWQYATETVVGSNSIALYCFGRKVREIKLSDIKSARQSRLFDLSLRLADKSHVRWPLPTGNFAARQVVEYALTRKLNDCDIADSELALAAHRWTAIHKGWEVALHSGIMYRHIPIELKDRHHDDWRALGCFMAAVVIFGNPVFGKGTASVLLQFVIAITVALLVKFAFDALWFRRLFEGEIEFRHGQMVLHTLERGEVAIPLSAASSSRFINDYQTYRVDGHRYIVDRTRLVLAPEKASVANVDSVPIIRINNY